MMLEDAKQHLEEVLKIMAQLQDPQTKCIVNKDYLKTLSDFYSRFKHWKPNVYIYIEGGVLHYAYSDSEVHLSVFDDDNEQAKTPEELEPGEEPYDEKKAMWSWMIDSGHHDGTLKAIY
jgi:hypothetical protein